MPLNEATARRPAMTPQQIREAERAIFGPVTPQDVPADLTDIEIQRMREIVHAHDRQHNKIQTFDLNNPPKEPYRYQEFPRMVYLAGDPQQFKIVQNADQLEVALMRGYTVEIAEPEREPELRQTELQTQDGAEHDDAAFEAYLAEQAAAAENAQENAAENAPAAPRKKR